jgi:hypothetical protein
LEGQLGRINDGSFNIEDIIKSFSAVKEQCNKICSYTSIASASKEQNEQFARTIAEVKRRVDIYEPGITILSDFSTAFLKELMEIQIYELTYPTNKDRLDKLANWEHNEQAKKLLASNDKNIRTAAERLDTYISTKASDAKKYEDNNCQSRQAPTCTSLTRSLDLDKEMPFGVDFFKDIITGFNDESIIDYSTEKYLAVMAANTLDMLSEGK